MNYIFGAMQTHFLSSSVDNETGQIEAEQRNDPRARADLRPERSEPKRQQTGLTVRTCFWDCSRTRINSLHIEDTSDCHLCTCASTQLMELSH